MSEFYFKSHRFLSYSFRLISHCFIIASFGGLREDHSFGPFDIAFPGVQMDGYPGTGNLVTGVMADRSAGENDGMLLLIHHGVITGAPPHALADVYVAIGVHVLDFVEILAVFDVKRVAGEHTVSLSSMNVANELDYVLLIVQRQ
jgi:hypothetical protein